MNKLSLIKPLLSNIIPQGNSCGSCLPKAKEPSLDTSPSGERTEAGRRAPRPGSRQWENSEKVGPPASSSGGPGGKAAVTEVGGRQAPSQRRGKQDGGRVEAQETPRSHRDRLQELGISFQGDLLDSFLVERAKIEYINLFCKSQHQDVLGIVIRPKWSDFG